MLREHRVDAVVRSLIVAGNCADVCGNERCDAVAKAAGYDAERHAGLQPCRRRGVTAVVDAQWRLPCRCERTVPRAPPVGCRRPIVIAGSKDQIAAGEFSLGEPRANDRDQHRRNVHRPRQTDAVTATVHTAVEVTRP
jgi:hypothetical protein